MKGNKPNRQSGGGISSDTPNPPSSSQRNFAQLAVRSAPLPLPTELEAYEAVLPGAAERILAMAESQAGHRQTMENKALSYEGRNSLLGIIAGWFLGTPGLLVAGYCLSTGHDAAGGAIGGVSLGSLVGTFIYGTRERRIEREQKYLAQTQSKEQR